MITLNSERGFEKVESWAEIEALVGFTNNLDPKEHELKEIIGRYIFKDKIGCGLSTCHQPHGKGYIVSTKSGPVTNIGHHCGKTHFNIEFEQMSKSFERDLEAHNNRESIGSFMIFHEDYDQIVQDLKPKATDLNKKCKNLIRATSGCPEAACTVIRKIVRNRDVNLYKARIATEAEVSALEAAQNKSLAKPHYIEDSVGQLQGVPFLFEENDLRKLLILDLETGLEDIEKLDLDQAKQQDLKHWSSWCSEFEGKVEKVREIIGMGEALLVKENLLQVSQVLDNTADVASYQSYVKKI